MVNPSFIYSHKSHNLSKKSCGSASNISIHSREIVRLIRFRSTESNLGTHLADTLGNPSSLAMMFCVRSYELAIVSAISLMVNLRSPIIRSHTFAIFSSVVDVVGRPERG
jgi:hypothetical protein